MKRYFALPVLLIFLPMAAVAAPASAAPRKTRHVRRAVSATHTVSFYATVLSADRAGLVVRTSSGTTVRFSAAELRRERRSSTKAGKNHRRHRGSQPARQFAHAAIDPPTSGGSLAVNVLALAPGVTVVISETVNEHAGVRVAVRLPPTNITVQERATGVVTEVQKNAFDLITAAGAELRLKMAQRVLASLRLKRCDSVSVAYHQAGVLLVADEVQVRAASSTGDCTSASPSIRTMAR